MQVSLRPAQELRIPMHEGTLQGELAAPDRALGLVLFVNGRGRGRHGLEDRRVASRLHPRGMAALLLDLLTPAEQQEPAHAGKHPADTSLLTHRVTQVVAWIQGEPRLKDLPLGLCGVAAGSTPALIAAARLGRQVQAIVSVGGQPQQAGPAVLASIKAPTLLLAGSMDSGQVSLNDAAYQHLRCERSLAVVPGGGPRLEEPGLLEHAGEMAADWFEAHLLHAEALA
jgi:putative phosphoribosyl transferase